MPGCGARQDDDIYFCQTQVLGQGLDNGLVGLTLIRLRRDTNSKRHRCAGIVIWTINGVSRSFGRYPDIEQKPSFEGRKRPSGGSCIQD